VWGGGVGVGLWGRGLVSARSRDVACVVVCVAVVMSVFRVVGAGVACFARSPRLRCHLVPRGRVGCCLCMCKFLRICSHYCAMIWLIGRHIFQPR